MKTLAWDGFTKYGGVLALAEHRAVLTDSADIEHYIDGNLRAVVPKEGQADYVKDYPQIIELIAANIPLDNPAAIHPLLAMANADPQN